MRRASSVGRRWTLNETVPGKRSRINTGTQGQPDISRLLREGSSIGLCCGPSGDAQGLFLRIQFVNASNTYGALQRKTLLKQSSKYL